MGAPRRSGLQSNVLHDDDGNVIYAPLVAGNRRLGVDATLGGGGGGVVNRAAVTFRTVTVAVPGTPVQGPALAVPDGFAVGVKFRSTQVAVSPHGYVGNSAANVIVATTRAEMNKGEGWAFKITNMNLLWFDSDTAGAVFELVAEQ